MTKYLLLSCYNKINKTNHKFKYNLKIILKFDGEIYWLLECGERLFFYLYVKRKCL